MKKRRIVSRVILTIALSSFLEWKQNTNNTIVQMLKILNIAMYSYIEYHDAYVCSFLYKILTGAKFGLKLHEELVKTLFLR